MPVGEGRLSSSPSLLPMYSANGITPAGACKAMEAISSYQAVIMKLFL